MWCVTAIIRDPVGGLHQMVIFIKAEYNELHNFEPFKSNFTKNYIMKLGYLQDFWQKGSKHE